MTISLPLKRFQKPKAQVVHKEDHLPVIAIVGSPNVGKSVLFNCLTGRYVTVSNYPGTTVETMTGYCTIGKQKLKVIDTPGMYGLHPITEEERIARELLAQINPQVVLHIVDAKNLGRMLSLTLQLIEAKLPVILVLNLMDELEKAGMQIDIIGLSKRLGVPVIPTVGLKGHGISELKEAIDAHINGIKAI
ncbi:MAG: FeoB small GTPase domain-containing protein [bacterium]